MEPWCGRISVKPSWKCPICKHLTHEECALDFIISKTDDEVDPTICPVCFDLKDQEDVLSLPPLRAITSSETSTSIVGRGYHSRPSLPSSTGVIDRSNPIRLGKFEYITDDNSKYYITESFITSIDSNCFTCDFKKKITLVFGHYMQIRKNKKTKNNYIKTLLLVA